MPDGIAPDPGLVTSFANYLSLPGQAIRNRLAGRDEAALRNLGDLFGDTADFLLPGDVIPEFTGEKDRLDTRGLLKEYGTDLPEGFAGDVMSFVGDVATDPVTYIPPAWVAKGGSMAAQGVKAITPKVVQEAVAPIGKKIRKTFGAEKIGKPLANVQSAAQGAKEMAARSSGDAIVEGLKGSTKRELEAARDVLTNVTRDKATKAARVIDESETLSVQDRLTKYVMENPDVDPDRLAKIVNSSLGVGKAQWESGVAGDVGGNIFSAPPGAPAGIKDYFPHIFRDEAPEEVANRFAGAPSAIKERKLDTAKALAEYLNKNPTVELADLAESMAKRGAAQGEMAARGAAGKGLMEMARAGDIALPDELLAKVPVKGKPAGGIETGLDDTQRKAARDFLLSKEFALADPLMRETAEAIAKALPGDEADVALHMLKGMEARKGFPKMLAALNSRFKPVAVYGALIPKLGSITRNMTGGVWQKYSNPEARGTISPANIPKFLGDWWASIEDGVERLFGKRVFTKNEFAQIDEAYKASGGDPRKALDLIKDPDMKEAVKRGVFGNNFVDTENLIAQTQRSGPLKFAEQAWDYPAAMFKGAEQRMRYGLYKSLVKSGKSHDDAARIVRDSLYDYSQSSAENRFARDVIPFFQFIAKSIPQQAKLMAEKPALASGVANLYSQSRDEPVMPYMEGKVNIPFGQDEAGNRQYLSSLGLPFESLSMLPNLSANPLQAGRDIEQSIVGSMSPLLKMPYSYISGRDPMFGSMPGSYTKVAGQDLGAAGGAINQLFSTGLGPAVAAQQIAGKAGQFTDDKTSLSALALNQLTGARVQSVDEDRALQQRVQALLERDPSIGQFRKFYSKDENDTPADALLQALQNAKQSLKAKREALVPVN